MRLLLGLVPVMVFSAACSTTYRFKGEDVERVRAGDQIANVSEKSGESVDFTHYTFVYKNGDGGAPLRVKGIESLNRSITEGTLKNAQQLDAAPGIGDKAWQRTTLGAGVGFLAGLGVGFAITNRVLVERAARDPACTTCSGGVLSLGTLVSAVIGGGVGAIIGYFGGSGVGQLREAQVQFLGDDATSQPASQP